MKLLKIIIEGFGSIVGELTYNFNQPGLSIIAGKNGVGKTTILNALSWCLFKQTIKSRSTITPWPQIVDGLYQGVSVQIFFKDTQHKYCVRRMRDYDGKVLGKRGGDRLIITQDGKELENLRNKADAEIWLNEKFGSFQLFKNTVLFGQKTTRLIDEDGPTKKRIFDEAFDTLFIVQAKAKVSKRLDNLQDEINQQGMAYNLEKKMLDQIEEVVKNQENMKKAWYEDRDKKVAELKERIKGFEKVEKVDMSEKSNLENRIEMMEKFLDEEASNKEFRLDMEINALETEMVEDKRVLGKARKDLTRPGDKCMACGQDIDLEKQKIQRRGIIELLKGVKVRIKKRKKKLLRLKRDHKLSKKAAEAHKAAENRLKEFQRQLAVFGNRLQEYKNARSIIKMARQDIDSYMSKDFEDTLMEGISKFSQEELNEKRKTVADLKERIDSLQKKVDIDEWLLKDPLSNSGLKAHIFDSMIEKVNAAAKQYTSITGFEVQVYINMDSAHKDVCISILKNGQGVPYSDMSGGQAQLIDITVAFALNDVVSGIKPINVLFLDELFESLDSDNVEIVGNIVQKKAETRSIHLITHQNQFSPHHANKVELKLNAKGQTIVA